MCVSLESDAETARGIGGPNTIPEKITVCYFGINAVAIGRIWFPVMGANKTFTSTMRREEDSLSVSQTQIIFTFPM